MGKRQAASPPERQTALVPTTSNWYPCFDAQGEPAKSVGHVRVKFLELLSGAGWRVCAWGADDFGMEIDLASRAEALDLYLLIVGGGSVTVEDLEGLGFKRA